MGSTDLDWSIFFPITNGNGNGNGNGKRTKINQH